MRAGQILNFKFDEVSVVTEENLRGDSGYKMRRVLQDLTNMSFVGLQKWELFANTDLNILTQITHCHVFSETRTQLGVLYIDHKDQVYAKGYNGKFNKLGVSGSGLNASKESMVGSVHIWELSNQNICTILTGYRHGAALSKNGSVFFWGLDLGYQDYSKAKMIATPKKINNEDLMKGESARQIACSGNALAILTRNGRLLVWGIWCGEADVTFKGEVPLESEPHSVVGGGWHFAVTSTTRHLYTFGDGGSGQLGYEWTEKDGYCRPRRVVFAEPVGSVACSQQATLVLLQPWSLYVFGSNDQGCLGVNSRQQTIHTPTRINLSEPVTCILASLYDGMFYAEASSKKVFRWGLDAAPIRMELVAVNSLLEAFGNRAIPVNDALPDGDDSTPMLIPEVIPSGQLSELANQERFSDITIKLADGEFKAHRSILFSMSEHFRLLLNPCWSEGQNQEIDMTHYDPKAYRAYLNYIYKGSLEKLEPPSLVQLYMIADEYLDTKLRDFAFTKFKSLIRVETVGALYRATQENSCEKLAFECYNFATRNIEAIVSHAKATNFEGFLQLLLSI